jgi:acetyl-CoA carboxylase carboxyl transferase subunit beta
VLPLYETVSPLRPITKDQKSYPERLEEAQLRTGLQDAVQTGTGLMMDSCSFGVMDFHFMRGMVSVVGENFRLIEYATKKGLTVILICASGGARMQKAF